MWEVIGSLTGHLETLCMQGLIDSLVIAAWQHMNPVELWVGELVGRKTLNVIIDVPRVVCAILPRFLGRLRFLRKELFLTLIRIPFILSCLSPCKLTQNDTSSTFRKSINTSCGYLQRSSIV